MPSPVTLAEINFDGLVDVAIVQPRTEGPNAVDSGLCNVRIAGIRNAFDEDCDAVDFVGDRETLAQFFRELARNLEHVGKTTYATTIITERQ